MQTGTYIRAIGPVRQILDDKSFTIELKDVTGNPWQLIIILKSGVELPEVNVTVDVVGELQFIDVTGYVIMAKEFKLS